MGREKVFKILLLPKTYGFYRYQGFTPQQESLIQNIVWEMVKQDPFRTLGELVSFFQAQGIPVSKQYLQRLFSSWRWTWKKTRVCLDPKIHR
jgi:transposase